MLTSNTLDVCRQTVKAHAIKFSCMTIDTKIAIHCNTFDVASKFDTPHNPCMYSI